MTQYYRRKQLNSSRQRDRRAPPSNSDRAVTPQRLLTPLNQSDELTPAAEAEVASISEPKAADVSNVYREAIPDASTLVQKAASILDEQMAAGVLAAQQARRSLPGYAPLLPVLSPGEDGQLGRTGNELSNTVVDWLTWIQGSLSDQISNVLGTGDSSRQVGLDTAHEQVPVLCPREAVSVGGSTQITFKLHNDDTRTTRIMLYCTDLLSGQGRIPQPHVVCDPQELQLGPDAFEEMNLQITVPSGTPAGVYSGLLIAPGLSYLRAIVTLEVA